MDLTPRSSLVPKSWNYLLNPAHRDFRKIRISEPMPFVFDARMWKEKYARIPWSPWLPAKCGRSPSSPGWLPVEHLVNQMENDIPRQDSGQVDRDRRDVP
jgi:hypothetical protein